MAEIALGELAGDELALTLGHDLARKLAARSS